MKKFKYLFKEMENPDLPSRAAMTYKEKPNKEPMPKLKEENDTKEKVEMTQSQLHFIAYACEEILEYIKMGGEVEEWYQVKVAKSFSEFESLHSFIEGEKRRTGMVEEGTEQLDELSTEKMLSYRAKAVQKLGKGTPEQDVKRKAGIGVSGSKIKQRFKQSMKKEETEQIDEVSSEMLDRYKEKAKKSADELSAAGQHKKSTDRWGNIMKATGKQITKTAAGIGKALRGEETEPVQEGENPQIKGGDPCWKGYEMVGTKKKGGKEVPNCVPTNEEKDNKPPFEGPYSKTPSDVTDKSGAKHTSMSRVKHLARQALQKQKERMGSMKTVKESKKTEIVKDLAKNKKEKGSEVFNPQPVLSSNITKT